jgi:multiple sugar transport system ATP-binding protein
MDEPLSNLDARLRVQMRAEISRLQHDLGVTTLYVTHDQVEAMTMGDRVAVMRRGELQQVAPPQELYDRPANLFVAGFMGSPAMNMLEASIERSSRGLSALVGSQRVALDDELVALRPALENYVGRDVVLGIRPESLADPALGAHAGRDRRLTGLVGLREALGSEVLVHLRIDARPAITAEVRELADDAGGETPAAGNAGTVIVCRFPAGSDARTDQIRDVAVDTRALHFFDPDSGDGVYATP